MNKFLLLSYSLLKITCDIEGVKKMTFNFYAVADYSESYIGTWNVRSMNQGKLEVVKQEMERMKVDILRISQTKRDWNG